MKMSALQLSLALLLLVAGAHAQGIAETSLPEPEDDKYPPPAYEEPENKYPPPAYEEPEHTKKPDYTRKPKPTYGCTKPGDWDKKGLKELKTCPKKEVFLNPKCVSVKCAENGYAKVSLKNCIPVKKYGEIKFISICYGDKCYIKKNVEAYDEFYKFKAKCGSKFTIAFFDEEYKGSHDSYTAIRKSGCSGHYNDKQMCKACGLYEYKIPCPRAYCPSDPKYPCWKMVDDKYCGCKKVPVAKEEKVVCRKAYGECDVAEYCDGKGYCPKEDKYLVDLYKPCRKSTHPCVADAFCDGSSRYCPKDDVCKPTPPKDYYPPSKYDDEPKY